jgi:hypothetical protein
MKWSADGHDYFAGKIRLCAVFVRASDYKYAGE